MNPPKTDIQLSWGRAEERIFKSDDDPSKTTKLSNLKSFANSRHREKKKIEADFDMKKREREGKREREREKEKGGSFLIRSEEEGNLKLYL